MKKFLLIIFLGLISFAASAQILEFRTTAYTQKQLNSYGTWSDWSPWQNSSMLIQMDLDKDIVVIYSPVTQRYKIIAYVGNYTDKDGEQSAEYKFIDQDGDRGTMKLMVRKSGRSEIYIMFRNIIWVYTVVRI